nr:hypothetical protein [Vicinamibacterales bacterium]
MNTFSVSVAARVTTRAAFALVLALLVSLPAGASAQQGQAGRPRWAWAGAVTPSSAVVKAKLRLPSAGARVRIARDGVATDEGRVLPAEGLLPPDADGVVAFTLDGLEPLVRYRYTIETGEGASISGSFRTFADGPFSFKVAFA